MEITDHHHHHTRGVWDMYEPALWKMCGDSCCLTDYSFSNSVKIILLLAKVITFICNAIKENTHVKLQKKLDWSNCCIWMETTTSGSFSDISWERRFCWISSSSQKQWGLETDSVLKQVIHSTDSFQLPDLHVYSSIIWNRVCF